MDIATWVLIIGMSLVCLAPVVAIIAQVMLHRERMRMIEEKSADYKRQVKFDVEREDTRSFWRYELRDGWRN